MERADFLFDSIIGNLTFMDYQLAGQNKTLKGDSLHPLHHSKRLVGTENFLVLKRTAMGKGQERISRLDHRLKTVVSGQSTYHSFFPSSKKNKKQGIN